MERRPFAALQRGDTLMALELITAPVIEPVSLAEVKAHLRIDSTSFVDDLVPVQSIAPGSHDIAAAYSLKGAGVNVMGYSAMVILDAGANGAGGTVDVKIQESDTNVDADYEDVAGGAFAQVTEANDNAVYKLAYTGTKQYIRPVVTVAGAACSFGVSILKDAATSPEDDLLTALIVAAREYCEGFQNRQYITATWDLWLDNFPAGACIRIPLPPLQSVTSIKYYDTANVEAILPLTDYFIDDKSEPGRVALAYGKSWPSTTLRPVNGVCIEFVAGYGLTTAVPKKVKQAILLLIGHWYMNREAAINGSVSKEIEFAVHALLRMERLVPV